MKDKFNKFSVPLGLLDYINPIFYTVTTTTIITNLEMKMGFKIFFIIGMIISLIFGYTIPTIKILVGLGKIKFKMPVNLVFYVNSGIFISGLCLLKSLININTYLYIAILVLLLGLLTVLYLKQKKFNTIAVLMGAIGYLLIYISLIVLSINNAVTLALIFIVLAIILYLFLIGIGIKADLKNPKVHWILESCNVLCQMFVMITTLILFK